jgi:methionyl aminopeptidase
MFVETNEQLEKLKAIGAIVADTLQYMISIAQPGMTTYELDQEGFKYLQVRGARSAPMLVYDFPGATCISVNEHGAHGIPKKTIRLKEGDLVNIDVSAEKDGFFADTGASFVIEPAPEWKKRLCQFTLEALNKGLSVISHGTSFQTLARTIEGVAQKGSYKIIENLGSHGVGKGLHEEPHFIPAFFNPSEKRTFKKSQVVTLEPFLTTGSRVMSDTGDGWTLTNGKGLFSAQYEHSLVVTDGEPILLTVPTQGQAFTKLEL